MSRAFRTTFTKLNIWSPSAQFSVRWKWPPSEMQALGNLLTRRIEPIPENREITLLTVRSTGSIERRETVGRNEVKGRLFIARPGDLVFSKIDVRNGAIGISPDLGCETHVTAEFPVYEVGGDEWSREFVKLLVRSTAFRRLLNSMISGASGRKRIQPGQLEQISIPFPNAEVRKRIVGYWKDVVEEQNKLHRSLERLVTNLNQILIDNTQGFEQVTLSKVFTVNFVSTKTWDLKGGRAAAFMAENPDFIRLGDFTIESVDTVNPRLEPAK
jgi:hypothetical protein